MSDSNRHAQPQRRPPKEPYAAQDVRQGRIVLNSPQRRAVFLAGLIGLVIVLAIVSLAAAF